MWFLVNNIIIYEDMYIQAAEHFPGIILDVKNRTLRFSFEKFIDEFDETFATCCLINPDREKTVEKAFETIKLFSEELRGKYLDV